MFRIQQCGKLCASIICQAHKSRTLALVGIKVSVNKQGIVFRGGNLSGLGHQIGETVCFIQDAKQSFSVPMDHANVRGVELVTRRTNRSMSGSSVTGLDSFYWGGV